jgi:hypothetical protein
MMFTQADQYRTPPAIAGDFISGEKIMLTPSPFGKCTVAIRFGIDGLKGIGNRSSMWQIMEAFCRASEGLASRVAFGPNGAIVMITVPGDANSGSFYLYDNNSKTFSSLEFERQEQFNPAWFDIVMTTYDLHKLIDAPVAVEKKPAQSHGQNHRRRRNRGRGHNNNQQVRIGDLAVAA